MKALLIKRGFIVDSNEDFKGKADILVEDGIITAIQKNIESESPDIKIIDAEGLYVFPGLVDMHVHLRDPGFIHKEDVISGCEAAAAGGVTSVACMPNTNPVSDNGEVIKYIKEKAFGAKAKVYPVAAITQGLCGDVLSDFEELKNAGAVALSNDGNPVTSAKTMKLALEKANLLNIPVISHCEDMEIANGGLINEGEISKKLGVKGIHRSAEDIITAREIALAAATDTPVHIAHVSTRGSVALIRDAKARNIKVTAESCPHYFMLDHEKLESMDSDYRMNPPLRSHEDMVAVNLGIIDGTIDCIATDHAPHTAEEKADFFKAPNGVVGLETSLAVALTAFYHTNMMELSCIARTMSTNPAKILGIKAGSIELNGPADLAVVDINQEWEVIPEKLNSRSKNTPFKGMTLKGKVKFTVCDGNLVFEDGKITKYCPELRNKA